MLSEDFLNKASVQNVLAEMEVARKEIAKKQLISTIIIIVAVIIGLTGYFLQTNVVFFVGVAVSLFIIALIIYSSITGKNYDYKRDFKEKIIAQVLKQYDHSIEIKPHIGLSENEFIDTQLFTKEPDRYYSEDLVTGRIDKTSFYFGEVHAEYKTSTGKSTHWHDIFKGIIFVADFNKHFNGGTVVRANMLFSSNSSWFENVEVVKLENIDFEDKFTTYSSDQVEARYILTPALMERILQLNSISEDTISLSFYNSRVYIAFPIERNCFEPPIFETLQNPKLLEDDINVLDAMMTIIHELDLNTRIWTKD